MIPMCCPSCDQAGFANQCSVCGFNYSLICSLDRNHNVIRIDDVVRIFDSRPGMNGQVARVETPVIQSDDVRCVTAWRIRVFTLEGLPSFNVAISKLEKVMSMDCGGCDKAFWTVTIDYLCEECR